MKVLQRFKWVAVAIVAALAHDAGLAAAQTADGKVLLRGAGATFPAPLYKSWIGTFQKSRAGVIIDYDVVGSGEGISRFVTGSVDFGASDAAMKDADIAKVERGVLMIPATAGMVVLPYNLPGVGPGLKLPRDVYPDIFLGKITKWNDPRIAAANPGLKLPNRSIVIAARLDGSGTTFAFTNHLSAVSEEWKARHGAANRIDWPAGSMQVRGNEGVAGRIKISEGAIGYVEYGFARRLKLPVAMLQNQAGQFVLPEAESGTVALASGSATMPDNLRLFIPDPPGETSYPIVTYTWLLLYGAYGDARKGEALKAFVGWSLSDGQQMAREMGYIPLPEAVIARGKAALARIP